MDKKQEKRSSQHAKDVIKGRYYLKVSSKIIKIVYLFHAIERIKKWRITEEMVAHTLIVPEEVIVGHRD